MIPRFYHVTKYLAPYNRPFQDYLRIITGLVNPALGIYRSEGGGMSLSKLPYEIVSLIVQELAWR